LNVLIPFLADTLSAKRMPLEIQASINALRKLRNKIAHSGVKNIDVSKTQGESSLCAVVFGLEYLRYIGKRFQAGA
jgi:hypothetical protein